MSGLILGRLTMSSREIAELTGKKHFHVKRDIEKMLGDLTEDASKFERIYRDKMNRQQTEYALDRELTETLLTGYSAVLRRKVIVRLRELEEQLSSVEKTLTQRIWALDARETESKAKAVHGSQLLHARKRELRQFRIERAEIEAQIQPSLLN